MRKYGGFGAKLVIFVCITFAAKSDGKVEALFSSKDKIAKKLIHEINQTQKRIYAAVYMLTYKPIAKALINAKEKRHVDVQIVTDKSCIECKYNKIEKLKKHGIDVFVFKPKNIKNKRHADLMHHKFALFDNKTWTGSYNWTRSASKKHKENVIYIDDPDACKKYEAEFETLKRCCARASRNMKMAKNTKKEKTVQQRIAGILKNMKQKFGK